MGRFLVHMHHGGDDGFGRLLLPDELQSIFKELFDLPGLLALEELRAGSNQSLHHPDAVFPGTAPGFRDLLFRLCPVRAEGFYKMEVQPAAAGIHIRVAGIFCLGALVMGFNSANLRPFVFGKAQDCILGFIHYLSPRFCQMRSYPITSAS